MPRWEKATATAARGDRYVRKFNNPSFSSTLLDEIYRSIDEGDSKIEKDLRFCGESMSTKQSQDGIVINGRAVVKEEEEVSALGRRACLIQKWMDKKVSQKVKQRKQDLAEFEGDYRHHDLDALFFSTTSTSSDSSSGGSSSSDTDSIYQTRSKGTSCFAPMRPKPVRTSIPARPEKTERTMRTLMYEERGLNMIDDYHYNSATRRTSRLEEENLIKSKSRVALKIYSNLKKMKQPISPGAKVASFINSLFSTSSSIKKSKNNSSLPSSTVEICRGDRKSKTGKESACSSVSSFSRPCLSKNSPSTRETLRNGVKRTVRFYPVSVIVGEDCKPCGHKSLNEQKVNEQPSLMSVSLPTAWKIGKSPSRRMDDEHKHQLLEKKRRSVEEMARKFLKDYHQIEKHNDLIMRDVCRNLNRHYTDVCDDDAASYSSSDLFELDHLELIGNDRHCQELPVYETTHVDTNRAIANGSMI